MLDRSREKHIEAMRIYTDFDPPLLKQINTHKRSPRR